MALICGIDPGKSGAIAFLTEKGEIFNIHDMPIYEIGNGKKKKFETSPRVIIRILEEGLPVHIFLEAVHSMPKQGMVSTFSFGETFGILKGIIATLAIPLTLIPPQTWKKALQVPASKDGARHRASQLFPKATEFWPLVKHDGRAESALIALHGLRSIREITDPPSVEPETEE